MFLLQDNDFDFFEWADLIIYDHGKEVAIIAISRGGTDSGSIQTGLELTWPLS